MGVLLATCIVAVVGSQITELMLDGVRARAVDQLQIGVIGHLSIGDFVPPYPSASIEDLSARLDPVLASTLGPASGVIRINVIGLDGTIIFSDKPSIRGKLLPPAHKAELAKALSGAVGSAGHSSLSTEENADLQGQFDNVLEVYVPIVLDRQIVGAYEIYQDGAAIERVMVWLWLIIVAASAISSQLMVRKPASPAGSSASQSQTARGTRRASAAPAVLVGSAVPASLTPRELQVLRLMATSHGYREIAGQLVVSEETVRTHAKSVLRKLHQPDRTRAVVAAVAAGILEVPGPIADEMKTPDRSAQGQAPRLRKSATVTRSGEPLRRAQDFTSGGEPTPLG